MSDRRERDDLKNWMQGFFIDYMDDDFFFRRIINRFPGRSDEEPLNGEELDRAELFASVIASLTKLQGSERAAANWLLYSPTFKSICGCAPLDYLEVGEFQALTMLDDVLQLAIIFADDPLAMRADRMILQEN